MTKQKRVVEAGWKVIRKGSRRSAIVCDPQLARTYPVARWVRRRFGCPPLMVFSSEDWAHLFTYNWTGLAVVPCLYVPALVGNRMRFVVAGTPSFETARGFWRDRQREGNESAGLSVFCRDFEYSLAFPQNGTVFARAVRCLK